MKKFVSKIMFAAVAVLSAAGFTSCNNADNPYVPEQITVQEQQDKYEVVPAYGLFLSNTILDMYDVKIVLHSGDKTQEVVPTKTNAYSQDSYDANTIFYKYYYIDVDGRKGVDYAEAQVTPKADIETTIKSMSDDEELTLIYGGDMLKLSVDKTNNRMFEQGYSLFRASDHYAPSKFLLDYENRAKAYELAISTK